MTPLSKMRRCVTHSTQLHTTAYSGTQLQRTSPSLPIIMRTHLCRKRNSFRNWSLLSEKRACSFTHESESEDIRINMIAPNMFVCV